MSTRDDEEHGHVGHPTHDGARGETFRSFKRDFLTIARGKFSKDDRSSWHSTFMRLDEGGTGQGAAALPAQAGGAGGGVNPAFTAATTKRKIRHGQAFTFLYNAITDDSIKEMLSELSTNNPAELAADAWDLVVNECDEPDDDLELAKLNLEWQQITILNTVGYSVDTITKFARELNTTNSRRPNNHRYDENDKCIKLLSSITYPESLAKDAIKELKARGAQREFNHGAPNHNRNYNAIVKYFDSVWRTLYTTLPIAPRAAQRGQRHETALLHTDEPIRDVGDDDPDEDAVYIVTMDSGEMLFYMGNRRDFGRRPGASRNGPKPVRFQRVCRNCWGMDHHASQCSSPAEERDLNEVMQVHRTSASPTPQVAASPRATLTEAPECTTRRRRCRPPALPAPRRLLAEPSSVIMYERTSRRGVR